MTISNRIGRFKLVVAAGVITLGMSTAGLAYAAGAFTASGPTTATNYTVYAGGGHNGDDFTNISYTPDDLQIYVGDSVTFVNADSVEPHTVTFGPLGMLSNLANELVTPVPSQNGPPTLSLLPKAVQPTPGNTYSGGFANSGVLSSDYKGITKDSWTITFTKPGVYEYYCLIHFPVMTGTITVNPKPTFGSTYTVQMGYSDSYLTDGASVADTFYPEDLTIHAGETVQWVGGGHTVTLGDTPTQIDTLRSQFVLRTGKPGSYQYAVNPAIAFPSQAAEQCGTSSPCSYSGGYLSSGLIGGLGGGSGGSFAVTFTKPGSYYYACLVHKGMDGMITVLPATTKS